MSGVGRRVADLLQSCDGAFQGVAGRRLNEPEAPRIHAVPCDTVLMFVRV